jgi:hypothetical protein
MGKSSMALGRVLRHLLAASFEYPAGVAYAARRVIIGDCCLAPPDPDASLRPRNFHRLRNFCGYSTLAV